MSLFWLYFCSSLGRLKTCGTEVNSHLIKTVVGVEANFDIGEGF